jgi:hypothetical protein
VGIAFSVRQSGKTALKPQQGADGIEPHAERALAPRRANRSGHDGPDRAQRQTANLLMKPNKTWSGGIGKQGSITSTSKHPPRGVLAGLILEIQAIYSNTDARYPITTAVQP